MRLSKLKLAGFKSFVDPTTISFPSQLVSIVGPNGCGKSNTIDAVRWVMGESSAKYLRGESMADVIFNGSANRKPVGQAHVELIFDNSDGKLSGEYANFAEIAVKRQVSRDGQSSYFLNNTRCRRKDIIDIIMGTGVGPRSYAIIEQGMISRLIDAKPEELRVYLEEVAGIAKYKERRKETETRIRHTKENLERLEDLRQELQRQLEHLHQQALTAEKYKKLKSELYDKEQQLKAMRWQALASELNTLEAKLQEQELQLEEKTAELRHREAQLEESRQQHNELNDELQAMQARFYEYGGEVSRLEQVIQHNRQRQQQLQQERHSLAAELSTAEDLLLHDQQQVEELQTEVLALEPQLAEKQQLHSQFAEELQLAEQQLSAWQQTWDSFQSEAHERSKSCDREQTRIEHYDKHLTEMKQRLERLLLDKNNLQFTALAESVQQLQSSEEEIQHAVASAEDVLQATCEKISTLRNDNETTAESLAQVRKTEQSLRGRIASLEALQQAALGKHNEELQQWLQQQQLADEQRLAEVMTVAGGWEKAVEIVFSQQLQALCLQELDSLQPLLAVLPKIAFSALQQNLATHSPTDHKRECLASKIDCPYDLQPFCAHIFCVDSLEQAMQQRHELQPHESFITPEGVWLGQNWLRLKNVDDVESGAIAREAELKKATVQLQQIEEQEKELQQQHSLIKQQLSSLETAREQQQQRLDAEKLELANLKASLAAKTTQYQQLQIRAASLEDEIDNCTDSIAADSEAVKEARSQLTAIIDAVAQDKNKSDGLQQQRQTIQQQLQRLRVQATAAKEAFLEDKSTVSTLNSKKEVLLTAQQRTKKQVQQLQQRQQLCAQQLEEVSHPGEELQQQLEQALEQRLAAEQHLQQIRNQAEALAMTLHELEKEKTTLEHNSSELRMQLEKWRLESQSLLVRKATIEEEWQTQETDIGAVVAALPAGLTESDYQQLIKKLQEKIARLGAINLAAIEEYETHSARKSFLDSQHQDLMNALETLENAILKIDKETRSRFKETFDFINSSLQELFPRMFGGGEAYLQLTDNDLLQTGVAIIARPPGKKNSTIHLLSGGEKALTAIALVFSLFRLNPAPFCMLDEVDAPLDDANVRRFTKLVREMSASVQFIFITHNKITMELADQLMGVTMREPGVSRIVSVDVDEATVLAAS